MSVVHTGSAMVTWDGEPIGFIPVCVQRKGPDVWLVESFVDDDEARVLLGKIEKRGAEDRSLKVELDDGRAWWSPVSHLLGGQVSEVGCLVLGRRMHWCWEMFATVVPVGQS